MDVKQIDAQIQALQTEKQKLVQEELKSIEAQIFSFEWARKAIWSYYEVGVMPYGYTGRFIISCPTPDFVTEVVKNCSVTYKKLTISLPYESRNFPTYGPSSHRMEIKTDDTKSLIEFIEEFQLKFERPQSFDDKLAIYKALEKRVVV